LRGQGTSAADRSGNYGTLDLLRALAWVRENAAAFGGDPDDVTIFGESAGARNAISLLVTPPAAGLFARAIAESGGTGTVSRAEAENLVDDAEPGEPNSSGEVLLRLLVADGKAGSREAARAQAAALSPDALSAYLLGKSPGELMAAYTREKSEDLLDVPQLIRDGAVLPLEP